MPYIEIEDQKELEELLERHSIINKYAFQDLDFTLFESIAQNRIFSQCLFLGCTIPEQIVKSQFKDCLIFPRLSPF